MLGLGLIIPKIRLRGIAAWFAAFIKRTRADGATTFEGKKCIQADGEYLITSKRGNIIADAMGDYATTHGGEGLEARACTAQAVNNLIYSPLAQARFMFLAEDLGTDLESYYCVSNNVDALEGDLAVFGAVTDTYGSNLSNGGIALSVKNGTAPYAYSWSNGSTAEDLSGLTKGIYSIQVKDSLGALASNSFTVRGDADPSIVTAGLRMDSYFTNSALEFPALGSAEFNGSSDFINMGEKNIATDLGITNAFTFGAWAYIQPSSTWRAIITMANSPSPFLFWFGVANDSRLHYNIKLSGGDKAVQIVDVPNSKWVYLNLSYDSSNLKLYLDGSIVNINPATGTLDGAGNSLSTNLALGAYNLPTGGDYFNGNLSNVAIWNRALTSDEINSVMWKPYQALSGTESNGLKAWYSLDDITSPAASLANMEQLATDKNLVIENANAITFAINKLS